ncbi:MAG: YitT family protein [Lachnospiraceae bacterium]|nr:YitT family protein [Lachnospiraceae bacterium]
MKHVKSLFIILAGNLLYSLAVRLFLMPSGLVTGGVTGISIALNSVTGIRVSIFAMILNVVMWILGLILLGKHFAFSTLISTLAFPVFLSFFETALGDYVITEDRILCSVLGGVLIGVALGIVLREDASTGGIDVIPMALNKYFKLSVSATMYAIDTVILLAQILVFPVENILYGILQILIYSFVLEKVLILGNTRTQMLVISPEHEKITSYILHEVDRGVTLLDGHGGYTKKPAELVLSIVSNRQVPRIEKEIRQIDPHAMIIKSSIMEVSGRGFTLAKQYIS